MLVVPVFRTSSLKTIALLTDFGTTDTFVGVVKAVLLSQAPGAPLIDLTHDVPPGDVAAAALRLWQAGPWLPEGSVILAVVDPGVGTSRRAVAVSAGRFSCVGPDNGIFTFLLAGEPRAAAVEIDVPPSAGSTFHGRDVFAPAAARLSAGAPLRRLGRAVSDLVRLPYPSLAATRQAFRGEVLMVDRFGNLVTSIGVLHAGSGFLSLVPWIPGVPEKRLRGAAFRVRLASGAEAPFGRTFSDVPPGSPVAYVGSDGLLEIGVNRGRAADLLAREGGAADLRGAEVSLLPS